MKCPYCKSGTEVINSRRLSGEDVWRRRKCLSCREIFTTKEEISHDSLFVIKRNLVRKRFVYEKLFASILYALLGEKDGDMGNSALLAKEISKKVIGDLLTFKSKYVSTKDIIKYTYHELALENDFYAKKYAMYSRYRMQVIEGKVK